MAFMAKKVKPKQTLSIVKFPDPGLYMPCVEVKDFTPELEQFVAQMIHTMVQAGGLGLAANQVGDRRRIFVMRDAKGVNHAFVNPKITSSADSITIPEGCLSVPGLQRTVLRYAYVTVVAQNVHGEEFTIVAEDIESVCIQHEIDHLNGIVFMSHPQAEVP